MGMPDRSVEVHYAMLLAEWNELDDRERARRLRPLQAVCADVAALRRGEQGAHRLQLEHDRLELDRERRKECMEEKFKEWANDPGTRVRLLAKPEGGITPETLERIQRELNLM